MRNQLALLLIAVGTAAAQNFPSLTPVKVVDGVTAPVMVTNAADGSGRLYIVEQAGRIRILHNGILVQRPFLDIQDRVQSGGEQGLLSVAFPHDYLQSRYFYVNYTRKPDGSTVIARYRTTADPEVADPASEQILLTIAQPYPNHNGGMLAFSPRDGYLYIGMGDGGSGGDPQNNAQNPNSLLGKMLRIDVSGSGAYSIPTTNPFANRSGYRPEIWALGVRNPWRFTFDRETTDLWIADVGQNAYEEIDFQPASSSGGENYGWRRMEGLHCFENGCSTSGLTMPVFEYDHSQGCSVTGGYVYRGRRWPSLRGWYIFADYCSGNIWALRRAESGVQAQVITKVSASITSFGEDEQGEIYFADAGSGTIYQLFAGSPSSSANELVNAGSFTGSATPGSLSSLFGIGLTTVNGIIQASSFPLPEVLAGTSVRMNGNRVPLLAVANVGGQEQVNFQVPWELEGHTQADLVIENNGVQSGTAKVSLAPIQPGLFAVTQKSTFVSLWATGLGPVENPPASGQPSAASRTRNDVRVTINGTAAQVYYAGLAPGFAGLYQVDALIPSGASGEVTVQLVAGGIESNSLKLRLD